MFAGRDDGGGVAGCWLSARLGLVTKGTPEGGVWLMPSESERAVDFRCMRYGRQSTLKKMGIHSLVDTERG